MKRKIRKRCKCGCGEITNYGKMYVNGHCCRGRKLSAEHKRKISEAARSVSDETKEKMSKAQQGKKHSEETKRKISESLQGKNMSDEAKLNQSLAQMKYDPNYSYCDVWKDREYKNDIRKDYCENVDCNKIYKKLDNHHIHLDKKRCAPIDIITLCHSCHMVLHHKLQRGSNKAADSKDFIVINRPDHVSYIHKKTHKIIKIKRKQKCG